MRGVDPLSAAAVGTVQVRSLVEPLRKIVARLHGHVLNAKVRGNLCPVLPNVIHHMQAVDLVMSERLLEVEVVSPSDTKQHIYVP